VSVAAGGNYYETTRKAPPATAPLAGDVSVDVAIVGGGLTGISAALNLAEAGFSVALLEAHEVGWGASGRNGGQVLPGFACGEDKIAALTDPQTAQAMWDMSVEGVEVIRARIARHAIDCDYRPGYLYTAIKPRQVRELAAMQSGFAALGAPAGELLTGGALRRRVDSPRYLAALEDPLAGHLHPLNYTLGLARAAQAAGVAIYTHTRVTRLHEGPILRLETPGGTVSARFALVAGGAYLGGLMRRLSGYIMPVATYIVATEPRADVAALLPQDDAVSDINFVLDYYRRSPDDRLLFGGRVSYTALPPASLAPSMMRRMLRVFPQLADARAEFLWGGRVDITRNRAPHFGRLAPNILFAQGFSGHGVALTGLAGRLAAEAIGGQAGRFDLFARLPHARFPGGRALRVPALVLATSYFRLRDAL
jgi:gamma-glutamylputrescine oxidase